MITPSSKKIRNEENIISLQHTKCLPERLPRSILEDFPKFLSLADASQLALVCKKFSTIPSFFLQISPHQIEKVLDICYKLREDKTRPELRLLPTRWLNCFNKGLKNLEEISIFYTFPIPKALCLKIISEATRLKKINILIDSQEILEEVAKLNITELYIELFCSKFSLAPLITNKSIKVLTVKFFNAQFDVPNIEQPLNKVEVLNLIIQDNDQKKITDFITHFPSMRKLNIRGWKIILSKRWFLNLKNLKEIVLHTEYTFKLRTLKHAYFLESLTLYNQFLCSANYHEILSIDDIMQNLTNLKVNFIFEKPKEGRLNFPIFSVLKRLNRPTVSITAINDLEDFQIDYTIYQLKHLHLQICLNLETCNSLKLYNISLMKNVEGIELFWDVMPIFSDDDYYVHGKYTNENALQFIYCCEIFAEKITSIKNFAIWTESVLRQLKAKPLKNCTSLTGIFKSFDIGTIPNSTLLELFPALTEDKIKKE